MKNALSPLLRRLHFPLLLLLSALPLLLMQLCLDAPQALPDLVVLSAAYLLACGVCLLVSGARRLPAAILCSGILLLLSALLLPVRTQPHLLIQGAALAALLFFSLPLATRQYESEIPPFAYVFGVFIHALTQFLHYYFGLSGTSPYAPIEGPLTAVFIAYVLLFLLSMNRISLDNASLSRHRLPASMRRFNTVLTLSFMAIALVLSTLPAVVRMLRFLWHVLSALLSRLGEWLLSLLPAAPDIGGSAPGGMMGMPQFMQEETAPSALALLLEKVFSVLTMLFLTLGSLFLAYMLALQLRKLARWLLSRFKRYVAAAASEYDDEVTDTREDGAARESRFTRRARQRALYDATPAGRIRQAYARLLHRNPKWAQSVTARETLPPDTAALYEQARYSDHPVTSEDAERFTAQTRKV